MEEKDKDKEETIELFRAVGQGEHDMVKESGKFPARMPWQPLFCPMLEESYAVEVARGHHTQDPASGYVGYVLRFRVRRAFIERYDPVTAGGVEHHREYRIPAEDLADLNKNLVGPIEVLHSFRGSRASSRH